MLSFHNFTWKFQPRGGGGCTLIFSYIRRLESFLWGSNIEGGWGCTLIFSYIHRLESFLWGSNIEFHYFGFFCCCFFFRKMNLWGYEDFVDIFGGSSQIGIYLGVISMHFRVFS